MLRKYTMKINLLETGIIIHHFLVCIENKRLARIIKTQKKNSNIKGRTVI